ncbi:hypothetical protein [Maricaulis parjimensis]|uniref:hypothetical protein n=1 Tax=Maricaulis parjimensis TaxID=144023 RepID=UPI001939E91D|nr:hypothetical protein [Maricaulis parjimensis]
MPFPLLKEQAARGGLSAEARALADKDLLTFCARQAHLTELAFTLADHGHTHVGHVARLSLYTIMDLAGGNRALAEELNHRLNHAGLGLDLELQGWEAPEGESIAPMID